MERERERERLYIYIKGGPARNQFALPGINGASGLYRTLATTRLRDAPAKKKKNEKRNRKRLGIEKELREKRGGEEGRRTFILISVVRCTIRRRQYRARQRAENHHAAIQSRSIDRARSAERKDQDATYRHGVPLDILLFFIFRVPLTLSRVQMYTV